MITLIPEVFWFCFRRRICEPKSTETNNELSAWLATRGEEAGLQQQPQKASEAHQGSGKAYMKAFSMSCGLLVAITAENFLVIKPPRSNNKSFFSSKIQKSITVINSTTISIRLAYFCNMFEVCPNSVSKTQHLLGPLSKSNPGFCCYAATQMFITVTMLLWRKQTTEQNKSSVAAEVHSASQVSTGFTAYSF